jgi:hypothetical protein
MIAVEGTYTARILPSTHLRAGPFSCRQSRLQWSRLLLQAAQEASFPTLNQGRDVSYQPRSPEVAREVIDALAASKRHEIIILSRNVGALARLPRRHPAPSLTKTQGTDSQEGNPHGLAWRQVNYEDGDDLVQALGGVHTVLSFVQLLRDPDNKAQKNLIDAAVLAGVTRFAPSEWGR